MSAKHGLTHSTTTRSVAALVNLYRRGNLNLEPAFQRQSVWGQRDRSALIDSILRQYPLPAIFLYTRKDEGKTIHDVIDGKQRIEALLHFMGLQRPVLDVRRVEDETDKPYWVTWQDLRRTGQRRLIEDYKLSIIHVGGAFSDIFNVFVRINSTGKPLTGQEKRNAKYHSSEFLKTAQKIADRFERYFLDHRILTEGQIRRMKHVELVAELMLSLYREKVLNKKAALDGAMHPKGVDGRSLNKLAVDTMRTLKRVIQVFPQLADTRFRKLSDFYSLAFLIGMFEIEGLVLLNKDRNKTAAAFLASFGKSVDEVQNALREMKTVRGRDARAREYLQTVREGTDSLRSRQNRHKILDGLLRSFFATKDYKRNFSELQRRLVWNSAARKKCAEPGCKLALTWDNLTIDHVKPHSKGGQTTLDNAALMCRKHNSAKGNRGRRARRA